MKLFRKPIGKPSTSPRYFLLGVLSALLLLSGCTNQMATHPAAAADTGVQHMRLTGRFDTSQADQASFTWPGSQLAFNFSGTSASLRLEASARVRMQLEVDGQIKDLWLAPGAADYQLAQGLKPGKHQVRLVRLTESFAIVTRVIGSPKVDGQLLAAPNALPHKLLVIGDSITAGYGNEGSDQHCHYAMETSNQQLSYAALAAKKLNADLQTIAWSGIGAWRSYGETSPVNPSILVRSQRTLADDANSQWDTSRYPADAVLINIGTNDYWNGATGEPYTSAMQKLIAMQQQAYPGKPIYLIVSPMLGGDARASQIQVLQSLTGKNIQLLDLGKIEAADGFGCDYHPNVITHTRLAQLLSQKLKQDLDW